jgi:3-oxoacyl-[acyl-carrier protein] reductase
MITMKRYRHSLKNALLISRAIEQIEQDEGNRTMKLLENRTAIITGGAQGIGLAIARTFAEQGANLVIGDLQLEQAEIACQQFTSKGVQAIAVRVDVRNQEQVEQMVARAVSAFGHLDVMVNNAGITRDATMRKMTLDDWEMVIDVHLKGTWLGTRAASAVMREQKSGSIVNISSISGKVGMIGQTNYSAAKAGIIGLTKAAAKELAYLNVRVNAVQPGLIRTAMTEALRPDIWEKKVSEVPMGRAGEPSEVANVVLFLASDLSSYMTGTVLEVTGGRFI